METYGPTTTMEAMTRILDRLNDFDVKHQENHECLRKDLGELTKELTETRLSVEHRLTKVEVKAGVWGAISGIAAALGITLFKH